MTDMTEILKSDLDKIPTQKNLVSDSFVIEMELESFVHGGKNKESNPNSRITLQRSLSRMRSNSSSIANDSFVSSTPSSPGGSPEKLKAVAEGLTDHSSNPQIHHQMITVTSGATESRLSLRRNSLKRSPLPWTLDPKRILLLFATLSSMGSILLIYFTLSICGTNLDVNALD